MTTSLPRSRPDPGHGALLQEPGDDVPDRCPLHGELVGDGLGEHRQSTEYAGRVRSEAATSAARGGGEVNPAGVIQMPWYEYQPEVDRFVEDMYAAKLVRPVDWMRWAGTPEAQQLTSDPAAIAGASHDDLIYLVTTILRGERFSDGEIASAYERGTLLAIAQRAQALLDGEPG